MKIFIENSQQSIQVTENIRKVIQQSIITTLNNEEVKNLCEISVTLVDNNQIRDLNRVHRNIDKPTDVLSFPLVDFSIDQDDKYGYDNGYLMLGDIVISLERAVEQANEYGHTLEREVGFLCVHSTLHLLGYDHDIEENIKIMRKKEESILNSINLKRN